MSDAPSPPSCSSPSPPSSPSSILHQNTTDPSARWLVQKFGGTSVGKFAVQIAKDIVSSYIDQHKLAIVCSARSGSTKALGTTNLLLRAASEARQRPPSKPAYAYSYSGAVTPLTTNGGTFPCPADSTLPSPPSRSSSPPQRAVYPLTPLTTPHPGQPFPEFNKTVDLIRSEHLNAARECVVNHADVLRELEDEIDRDCDWLRGFLFAAQVIDEISPRSKDSIIGFGERLGCKLVTAVLRDQGIDAEYVSLEDIIPLAEDGDTTYPEGGSLDQSFYDGVAVAVGERIKQCAPRVPVVTGFFGPVPGSLLGQVGRGYTDLLSALLAVGLDASELQIWKEVDGIFTADPRKVPTARLIPIISPDEAAELTYYGSEVVHPFTMEQVIRRKIPIRIKNVENPLGGGTVIHPDPDPDPDADVNGSTTNGGYLPFTSTPLTPSPSPSPTATTTLPPQPTLQDLSLLTPSNLHSTKRLPTAVTIKEHILLLNINSTRKSVSHGFLARIFSTLDRFGVVVDLISTSQVHVSMAIQDSLAPRLLARLRAELERQGSSVSVSREMAILSLVGRQMRNMVGISGRMFVALAQGNVNMEMISQGASEINISCVIRAGDAVKALNLIHQSCLLIAPGHGVGGIGIGGEVPRGRVGPWLF
ncbi:Aspartate/glutamate/uridylate kinase [Phlebopus sp. FC_14]|nr:Aspartate/glutamate/uridylate kinase [Phlebopus sp. FC_14]